MQDLGEQCSGDGDFCELECDVAAVAHDLRADLDELFPQRGQRPETVLFGQCRCPFRVKIGSREPRF